jgi:peptide-methionine (S)-S-oxide reductase
VTEQAVVVQAIADNARFFVKKPGLVRPTTLELRSHAMKKIYLILGLALLSGLVVYSFSTGTHSEADQARKRALASGKPLAKATFAGGCFWCMEPPFEKLDGVVAVTSGYMGGFKKDPTYDEVSAGRTGHAESIEILYDPAKISYAQLLDVFWHNIDPTVKDRQFCDVGGQYRSAIFYHDQEQKKLAEQSKQKLTGRFKNIYTEIVAASTFYPAEDYHQDFYKKNPVRYKSYRYGCGRDARLKELWGDGKE